MLQTFTNLHQARAHILNRIASLARLSYSTTNMSQTQADPVKAEAQAKLDAHFEKVAQTYEEDGMGVQNALCRQLL